MKKSTLSIATQSKLISKNVVINEKRLGVCFNLIHMLESSLKDGKIDSLWTCDEYENSIYMFYLNNWVLFEDPWKFYDFLYDISGEMGMKFTPLLETPNRDEDNLNTYGYSKEEIEAKNYKVGEEWRIFFEKPVEKEYRKKTVPPYFVLKIDLKNRDEVISALYKLIDEYLDYFANGDIKDTTETLPFKKQRNIFFNAILSIYESTGYTEFTLQQRAFARHIGFHFTYLLLWFWRTGYIEILEANNHNADDFSTEEDGGAGHFYMYKGEEYPNNAHKIRLSETLIRILEGMGEVKNTILDKIFDEDYKRISFTRRHGEFHMFEGEKEIEAGVTKFVDLQKQYPYGEISAVNHGGKAKKYKVKERLRLGEKPS